MATSQSSSAAPADRPAAAADDAVAAPAAGMPKSLEAHAILAGRTQGALLSWSDSTTERTRRRRRPIRDVADIDTSDRAGTAPRALR